MTRPVYRTIDHTADMAFEVEGDSFADLLRNATAAVADVLVGWREGERLDATYQVTVSGADREDVLVAWLNEVVVLFEDEGFLARGAQFADVSDEGAHGTLLGRGIDFQAEPPDRVIKAVTYHDLRIVEGKENERWRATVVLDL